MSVIITAIKRYHVMGTIEKRVQVCHLMKIPYIKEEIKSIVKNTEDFCKNKSAQFEQEVEKEKQNQQLDFQNYQKQIPELEQMFQHEEYVIIPCIKKIESTINENTQYFEEINECQKLIDQKRAMIQDDVKHNQQTLFEIGNVINRVKELKTNIENGNNIQITQQQINQHNNACHQILSDSNADLLRIKNNFSVIQQKDRELTTEEEKINERIDALTSQINQCNDNNRKSMQKYQENCREITDASYQVSQSEYQLKALLNDYSQVLQQIDDYDRNISSTCNQVRNIYQQINKQHNDNLNIIQRYSQPQDEIQENNVLDLCIDMETTYNTNESKLQRYQISDDLIPEHYEQFENIKNIEAQENQLKINEIISLAKSENVKIVNDAEIILKNDEQISQQNAFRQELINQTYQLYNSVTTELSGHYQNIQMARNKLNTKHGKIRSQQYKQQLDIIKHMLDELNVIISQLEQNE